VCMESWVQSLVGPPTDKYVMRYQDIIQESVALQYMGAYAEKAFPIYRNANAAVFNKLINSTQYTIRGLLDTRTGDLYFWDAYAAAHVAIKNELGLDEPMHLVLYPDSVMIVPTRGANSPPLTREMAEPVRRNRNVQRIFGRDPQIFVTGFPDEIS
jgi:hypothetical protein